MEKYTIARPYYHHEKAGVRVVGGNVRTTRVTVENNIAVKPIILNSDHTHFLMADNGFNGERSLSGAARLRAALEKHINETCTCVSDSGSTKLPKPPQYRPILS